MTASATKMKYSEMPREMSSDSVVAMRLARGSPCRSPPTKTSSASSTSSSAAAAAAGHASTGGGRRSASAFRSHCLGRKESPEPDGSLDDLFNASGAGHHRSRRGASPTQQFQALPQFNSLPRSTALKSASLPASGRSGLSTMLCVDPSGRTDDRSPSPLVDHIWQVSAESLAAQLTLLDAPVFKSIQPEELSTCGWTKKNKIQAAPNVVAMTRRFNQVIFWTVEEVLRKDSSPRQRADVVAHFIRVGRKLHEMNNLHSLFAVVSALRSASVFRLKKTWAAVPKKELQHLERLADLFSDNGNWEKLRQHMDTLRLPCVPYLGLFLTDLIFIDMAHPHYGGLESQQRQLKMNNILRIVSSYQQSDYSHLTLQPAVIEYLRRARYIEELQKLVEDDHFKLSLKLEPPTPPSSSASSKESFYDAATAVGQLGVGASPHKASSSLASSTGGGGDVASGGGGVPSASAPAPVSKFVPGHHKSRSLGTNIFRNVQQPSQARVKQCGSQSCITASNQAFDSTLRNLIDDSVQEENAATAATTAAAAAAAGVDPLAADGVSFDRGSSHSLSGGVDSPVPPPPVRCCCIQGCVRKKTILKDGRRPAVSSWQRFWIQVSGPVLVFYSAKSLRGSDRSDFRREPHKMVCVAGWTVNRFDSTTSSSTTVASSTCSSSTAATAAAPGDAILLVNPFKRDEYKLRIGRADAFRDWLFYLSLAVHARPGDRQSQPANLMSFE